MTETETPTAMDSARSSVSDDSEQENTMSVRISQQCKRSCSVVCNTQVELLCFAGRDFLRLIKPEVVAKMGEYAKSYFTDDEVKKTYQKQKTWQKFKVRVPTTICRISISF
eukprot:GEZU01012071.1.p1 GENE.GEZU01012071.1~~GEZU01012071.1.p1  ORF type:complete len:120 (-),score=26.64 GEZU01012071.1:479-811(-)